jgi:hypothetical protein
VVTPRDLVRDLERLLDVEGGKLRWRRHGGELVILADTPEPPAFARLVDYSLGAKSATPTHVPGTFEPEEFRAHTRSSGVSNYQHVAFTSALDALGLDAPAKYIVTAAINDSNAESLTAEQIEQRYDQWPEAIREQYEDAVAVINRGFPHGVSMMLLDRLHSAPQLVVELAKLKPRVIAAGR